MVDLRKRLCLQQNKKMGGKSHVIAAIAVIGNKL